MAFVRDPDNICLTLAGQDLTRVQSSGVYQGNTDSYAEWRAFDNSSICDNIHSWCSNGGIGWLSYTFNKPTVVGGYTITASTQSANVAPISWTFDGTNDDVTWTTIHSLALQPSWTAGETRKYLFSGVIYKKYRIRVTRSALDAYDVYIGELEILKGILVNKQQLKHYIFPQNSIERL